MRTYKSLSEAQNHFNLEMLEFFTFWGFMQSQDKQFCHLTMIASNLIQCVYGVCEDKKLKDLPIWKTNLGTGFQRIIVLSYCSPSKCRELLTECTMYHTKRLESSATLLWEPPISQHKLMFKCENIKIVTIWADFSGGETEFV